MSAKKVDLRAIMARVGRLQSVLEDASILIAGAAFQQPMNGATDARGYWVSRADDIDRLARSIERAANCNDGATDVAGIATVGTSTKRPANPIPVDLESVFEIRLPYAPNRDLAANKVIRGHWGGNADVLKSEKERAARALAEWIQDEPFYTSPVGIDIEIGWGRSLHAGKSRAAIEQDRPLDLDGVVSCLKPILDALTAVKIWKDDRLMSVATQRQTIDPTGDGYTRLAIWELER